MFATMALIFPALASIDEVSASGIVGGNGSSSINAVSRLSFAFFCVSSSTSTFGRFLETFSLLYILHNREKDSQ